MAYFDHNATTPLDPRVGEAMRPYLDGLYGNPSATYRLGRVARSAIDTARSQVAALVGATPSQVVFTSGGTEANNLALRGFAQHRPACMLAVSAIEHASVLQTAELLESQGHPLHIFGVDAQGRIASESLSMRHGNTEALASIMLANNETGVLQDVARLAAPLRANGYTVHTDAVQAAGKIPISFNDLGVNLLSLSSHKIYGPKGCGALVLDGETELSPQLTGGGQEHGLRSGTENVAAIVGFGKAAEIALTELAQRRATLRQLREHLLAGLKTLDGLSIFSETAECLPNTVQFAIAGQDGETLLMQLDRAGIALSSGSACSRGREASHVLAAMGVPLELANAALRVSLGSGNTLEEIDVLLIRLREIVGNNACKR